MCNSMAKENSGIDARQAFNMAIHQWMLRIMSKIEDAASRGDTCYYADVARSEVPMYKEIAKRLADKGYTTELKESDDLAHLEISWMLADEKEPDDDRIKPINRIKDLPEGHWALEDYTRRWTIKQWHDKVVELNGMISFLQTEQTKMQNKMNQITIENTWLEADSYKIPFNRQVVACLEDEQLVIGVLTKPREFIIQYVIDPRNDTKINDAVIKQWKYATWPNP